MTDNIVPFPGTCRHHIPDAPCDVEVAPDAFELDSIKLMFGSPKQKTHAEIIIRDDLIDALRAYEAMFGLDGSHHTREMVLRFLEASK